MESTNYAMVQRAAVFSWEAMTTLLATDASTGTVKVSFPRPVVILSMYPAISVAGGAVNLDTPTLDDILVKIEIDTGFERRLTSRFDAVLPNGVGSLQDATLGSFKDTMGGARVMNYEIGAPDSRPEVQIVFSWKRSPTGGPWFRDVFVSLVLHCNFMDGRQ
jgi:hypothetical protein